MRTQTIYSVHRYEGRLFVARSFVKANGGSPISNRVSALYEKDEHAFATYRRLVELEGTTDEVRFLIALKAREILRGWECKGISGKGYSGCQVDQAKGKARRFVLAMMGAEAVR